MKSNVNQEVKRANYERGMKYGEKVYCGEDLRKLIGLTVIDVDSDENDQNVVMRLEGESRNVAVYLNNLCLDGECIAMVEHVEGECSTSLRPVTEDDLRKISTMNRYTVRLVVDENDNTVGVNHMYCNDIGLEGKDGFETKSLYVFYDGRILTENFEKEEV